MNKSELRKKFRAVRNSVSDRDFLSDKIAENLFDSDLYKNADAVFCYWAVDSEVQTKSIIKKALADQKKVALPKCTDKNGNMTFYYINSLSDLIEGMYGIMEPPECFAADVGNENSICIVPALAFDSEGYRLGYGKGYYDRFLSIFSGISIGVCFQECLTQALPRNEFDKKVNYIITDKNIYSKLKEE